MGYTVLRNYQKNGEKWIFQQVVGVYGNLEYLPVEPYRPTRFHRMLSAMSYFERKKRTDSGYYKIIQRMALATLISRHESTPHNDRSTLSIRQTE